MGALGYRRKTSFQTGMMAAQISEFSLILVALGVSLGQVAPAVLSIVTLVGIITIFISSYLILYSDVLYVYAAPYLRIFERSNSPREKKPRTVNYPVILIGSGRVGFDFIKLFKKEKQRFLVVDHDPEVISQLEKEKVPHIYGDVGDPDFLEEIKASQAKLIVSTAPDLQTNLIILSCARRLGRRPAFVAVAHRTSNALALYEAGADYVILPHFLGSAHAASLVGRYSKDMTKLQTVRNKHIINLQTRIFRGHDHPEVDRAR